MKRLFGVTVALVTPFTENGGYDAHAMERLVEAMIGAGVNCLYPCGTTGEMFHMSSLERMGAAETVVRAARGRVPVFIHTGANTLAETLSLSRHAHEIGADGVGVVTPMFLATNDREMENYYVAISRALPDDFPMYLYNIPQCAANNLTAKTAGDIVRKTRNVVGIKYSFSDLAVTGEYLNIRDGFSVLHGSDSFFASYLILGCTGTVSGVANVFPEPLARVYAAYERGDIGEATRWQKIAREFCATLRCGANMAYFKSGMRFRGLDVGPMRLPQLDLSPEEENPLWASLAALCQRHDLPRTYQQP